MTEAREGRRGRNWREVPEIGQKPNLEHPEKVSAENRFRGRKKLLVQPKESRENEGSKSKFLALRNDSGKTEVSIDYANRRGTKDEST